LGALGSVDLALGSSEHTTEWKGKGRKDHGGVYDRVTTGLIRGEWNRQTDTDSGGETERQRSDSKNKQYLPKKSKVKKRK